ncbi:DUF3549 family protein [Thalassotalea sp. SU-HH00458]|uniref:DUF3549 family protein n=1 Tax=Thalassotalea sp. SU-HH00458 TaxID=3127657 RepID=UPI00310BEFB7
MTTIASISELLTLSNCQFRVYDLGRKIDKLSKETFNKVELNQLPYPTPFQGHAHLAITFWQKQSPQPFLWFVKLPLDERGLLNQGARNHFVAIIAEALGADLSVDPTEKQEELLKSNPYIFTPSQYKLAMLNSLISFDLKSPPSQHYQSFQRYLTDKNWQQWQTIGVQGITDFVARIGDKEHDELIANSLADLPFEVLSPLCGALENKTLSLCIIESLLHLLSKTPSDNLDKQQMLLRSLASSTEHTLVDNYFLNLLNKEQLDTDLLICISGRCWTTLNNDKRIMLFLEHLAAKQDFELFTAIFKDLVAIPTIRPILFQCMRSTERSETLSVAIGQLFTAQG